MFNCQILRSSFGLRKSCVQVIGMHIPYVVTEY